MAYGTVKVDNITFDNGGSDQNVTVSGLYRATTSGVTVSGTIVAATVSGVTIIGSTTVSGATVTGTTANFTSGNFSNIISSAATMSGALIMANQQQVRFREAVGNGVNHIALQAPAIVSADQTITLPDQTGTVVTTGDNGSVSSTMLAANLTISAAAGSAAAPSIAFTGDTNTGIYSPGADQLAVATNGTGRLFVGSDGSVGVGASALATVPLLLNDTGNGLVLQNAASGNYAIGLLAGTGSQDAYIYQRANAPLIIGTNNTERLRIDSSGRVGIGTASPTQLLSLAGTSANILLAGTSNSYTTYNIGASNVGYVGDANWIFAGSSSDFGIRATSNLVFGIGATERLRIDSSGNVGIGTSSPTTTLDVNGDVTISDKIIHAGDTNTAIRFPAADTVSVETDGSERLRITSTGAVLVGATTAPTDVADGDIALQNRLVMNASAANYGQFQRIADVGASLTATTGTIVFKFKSATPTTARSAYVKINLSGRANNSTPSNHPACEYAFQLHNTNAGVCSINGTTTIFEYIFVRATHFAFADLGSGECTVTLTTPVSVIITPAYMVEINTQLGAFGLDAVTVT